MLNITLFNYIISLFVITPHSSQDTSLINLRKYIGVVIERNMPLPPEIDSGMNCFSYSTLINVDIYERRVSSIRLSDSAPEWLKNEVNREIATGQISFERLNKILYTNKYLKCSILIPLTIQSMSNGCVFSEKPINYSKFNGRSISGCFRFVDEIKFQFHTISD